MRNTDYEFVSSDVSEMESEMISAYEEICGVTVRPASAEMLFIKWVLSVLCKARVSLNYAANQNIPSRAEGDNLDALAELFYTHERPQATAAYCTMSFGLTAAQTSAVIVPAGTRITDINRTLYWKTESDITIAAGSTSATAKVVCMTTGEDGNGWTAGQINSLVDPYDYYGTVQNTTTSAGGADIMDDDDFYELLRKSMDAFSAAGSKGAYEYHAKAVSSDIADVLAVRPSERKTVTPTIYTSGSDKYVFLGGDRLSTTGVVVKNPNTDITSSCTVTYANGLMTVKLPSTATSVTVTVSEDGAGLVDIYALMNDGTLAGSEIKAAIATACSADSVRPLTDKVEVKDATTTSYTINLTYYVSRASAGNASAISTAVTEAVNNYIEWQSAKLGRDINPSKLIELVMGTGVKRVVVTSPTYTVVSDGSSGTVPGLATLSGTATITNGGIEEE